MYNRPSGGDGTGDVGVEYESGGTTQDTDFVSYEKAIDIIKKNLAENNIDEIRFPQTDFTRSQLVPRMESMVDRETYKKYDVIPDYFNKNKIIFRFFIKISLCVINFIYKHK